MVGEFNVPAEESDIADAYDPGAAFATDFEVLAGAHGVKEGTYDEAC